MPEPPHAESDARAQLEALRRAHPLPDGAEFEEAFLECVEAAGLPLFMVGLIAKLASGKQAIGSAAAPAGFPVERAYYELLERASLQLAREGAYELAYRDAAGAALSACPLDEAFPADADPSLARASVSNGAALHRTWSQACEAACAELVERDRVLRAWDGELAPVRVDAPALPALGALTSRYESQAFSFDPPRQGLRYRVGGLFLFPCDDEAPLVYGFGAARDAASALAAAAREAIQRLAFLWGEAIPSAPPEPTPTPDYHQEFYLVPAHRDGLRAWLAGKHATQKSQAAAGFDGAPCGFVDLTPPSFAGRLRVVRARSQVAKALVFGCDRRNSSTPPHPIA